MRALMMRSLFLVCLTVAAAGADEGMWTLDNLPLKWLKEKYGFVPTQTWLDHVRLSCVRLNDGGSGAFVSPKGLVLTNQHVIRGQLQKLTTSEVNRVQSGHMAHSSAEEIQCPDLEINVLLSMENVTARIAAATAKTTDERSAAAARQTEMDAIQKESVQKTGLRSDIVTLYHGGEYWLYRYKKYTDVRIVFAAEQQIGFYGGKHDNFAYPRYELDMALVRVYENGKPLDTPHYLKWNSQGAKEGEFVMVAGHPGTTERLKTVAQLETQRDVYYPAVLRMLLRRLQTLQDFAARGESQASLTTGPISGTENGIKAIGGYLQGLRDRALFQKKIDSENAFRASVDKQKDWQKEYGSAWDEIASAEKDRRGLIPLQVFRAIPSGTLASLALDLVNFVHNRESMNESQRASRMRELLSPAVPSRDLSQALMASSFQGSLDELGADDPLVKIVLNGKTPSDAAKEWIAATRMDDIEFRKQILSADASSLAENSDPLIRLAVEVRPILRETSAAYAQQVQARLASASERIGKARFAVYGRDQYPDATFTLRLAFGTLQGYAGNHTLQPAVTTWYGLFDRALSFGNRPPFDIPQRYWDRKDKLDLSTPSNFAATLDIIGGNSGSPVINREGEVVGLIHDSNVEGLVGNFIYNEETGRAISNHTSGMLMALRSIYDLNDVADELEGKRK